MSPMCAWSYTKLENFTVDQKTYWKKKKKKKKKKKSGIYSSIPCHVVCKVLCKIYTLLLGLGSLLIDRKF